MRRRTVLAAAGAAALLGQSAGSEAASGTDAAFVTPDAVLVDEELAIELHGLPAEETVVLTARTEPVGEDREVWSSTATFRSRADGTVSLAAQAPLEGSYEGVDPMGLFWSMRVDRSPEEALFPAEDHRVTLTAAVDGEPVAETTITRRYGVEGVEVHEIEDDGILASIVTPPGEEPAPGVVLTHGSVPFQPLQGARLLASRGFAVMTLQYYNRYGGQLPDELSEVPLEYGMEAIGMLLDHDRVRGSEVGFHGPSYGSQFALLLAAHDDRIGAVVGEQTSHVVWEGLDRGFDPSGTSSWSLDGDPLPFLFQADSGQVGDRDPRAYFEISLREADVGELEAATIPLEESAADVLLLSGSDDRLYPSTESAERVVERLDDNGYPHDYDHLVFEDAGHLLVTPYLPTYGASHFTWPMGGTPEANARASRKHWPAMLDFFAASLPDEVEPATVESPVAPLTDSFFERNRTRLVGGGGVAAVGALVALAYRIRTADPESTTGGEISDKLERKDLLEGGETQNALERIVQLANRPETYAVWGVSLALLAAVFGMLGYGAPLGVTLFAFMLLALQAWLRFAWPHIEAFYDSRQRTHDPGSFRFDTPSSEFLILATQAALVFAGIGLLLAIELWVL